MIQKHRFYDNGGNFIREIEEEVPEVIPAEPEPTEMELAQQAITDLELNDIEQGQAITDLEIQLLEVQTNV